MNHIYDLCSILDASDEIIGLSVVDKHLHIWFDNTNKTHEEMVQKFTRYVSLVDAGAVVAYDGRFDDEDYDQYRAPLRNGWSLITLIRKETENGKLL